VQEHWLSPVAHAPAKSNLNPDIRFLMNFNREDPVLTSARREAWIVFFIWLAAMTYTVTYCYLNGYGRSIESLTYIFGFPDWVFWGIVLPWVVCAVGTSIFALWFMKDADFGEEGDSPSHDGEPHE
jgi:hypothetical protein